MSFYDPFIWMRFRCVDQLLGLLPGSSLEVLRIKAFSGFAHVHLLSMNRQAARTTTFYMEQLDRRLSRKRLMQSHSPLVKKDPMLPSQQR